MKWLDNAYCHDNDYFTSGIYGSFEDARKLLSYPAYYGGEELGKFERVADAKEAVERAHAERHGLVPPRPKRVEREPTPFEGGTRVDCS